MKNRGLGRGLSELFGESAPMQVSIDAIHHLDLSCLEPNKHQPRQSFNDRALDELAESIKRSGVIQPIVVRSLGDGRYSIIAGERRFRASKIAGLVKIPAIVKDVAEEQVVEFALVENIQREDLTVIEEAESYKKLIENFAYKQEDLSMIVGKSRSHVANILRLNTLPDSVKELMSNRTLNMGQAKSLVGHKDAEEIAATIVYKGLNSRQSEQLVKNWGGDNKQRISAVKNLGTDDDLADLVENLSEKFGMKITIENNCGSGKIIFHFSSFEQLDSILMKLA